MQFPRVSFMCVFIPAAMFSVVAADEVPLRGNEDSQLKFLVLTTGRVVQGDLVPRPGGYDVTMSVGRMFVPSTQIRFTAASMDDAYQRMRDSVADLTPDTHMALARWCLSNNLHDKARREVLDARHLDPYRDDARLMLEDLERERQRGSMTVNSTAKDPNRTQAESEKLPERRSLGGLPQSLAQEFTQRIQPLVSNKCSNSRCHGAGQNSFVVVPTFGRSTAVIAEQNLAAILNQVNFDDPVRSPILEATIGLHGGNRSLMFSGRSGGMQAQTLRRWVTSVVQDLGPNESRVVMTTAMTPSSADDSIVANVAHEADPGGRVRTTKESDLEFLAAAAVATRHDDFDPDEFNQRYHARSNQNPVSVQRTNVAEESR